jgi:hypothetical protein
MFLLTDFPARVTFNVLKLQLYNPDILCESWFSLPFQLPMGRYAPNASTIAD